MSSKPVSELDFRIFKLNDVIKNFKKTINTQFTWDNYYSGFNVGFCDTVQICTEVNCYKDATNPKIVVCEVITDISKNKDSKKKVEKIKFIYDTILDLAKTTIHSSFDKSHLRVIIKREKPMKRSSKELDQIYEDFEDFLLSYVAQEEILVIWENGVPYYQEAFFED